MEQGLVDELRVVISPIILGASSWLFTGVKDRMPRGS